MGSGRRGGGAHGACDVLGTRSRSVLPVAMRSFREGPSVLDSTGRDVFTLGKPRGEDSPLEAVCPSRRAGANHLAAPNEKLERREDMEGRKAEAHANGGAGENVAQKVHP
jgi:hypothetical protein